MSYPRHTNSTWFRVVAVVCVWEQNDRGVKQAILAASGKEHTCFSTLTFGQQS